MRERSQALSVKSQVLVLTIALLLKLKRKLKVRKVTAILVRLFLHKILLILKMNMLKDKRLLKHKTSPSKLKMRIKKSPQFMKEILIIKIHLRKMHKGLSLLYKSLMQLSVKMIISPMAKRIRTLSLI